MSSWGVGLALGLGIPLILIASLGFFLWRRGKIQLWRQPNLGAPIDNGAWKYEPIHLSRHDDDL